MPCTIVAADGVSSVTVERIGDGPGEFRQIVAVGEHGPDSVVVMEYRHQRVTHLNERGEFVASWQLKVEPEFAAHARIANVLRLGDRGVYLLHEGGMRIPEPIRTALLWHSFAGDSVREVGSWPDQYYVRFRERHIRDVRVLPPRAYLALSHDGRVATGNGLRYCITLRTIAEHSFAKGVRELCRVVAPVSVGPGIRNPDLSLVRDDAARELMAAALRETPIPEELPAFDRLLFDDQGNLWVRTLGPEMANAHPGLTRNFPHLLPETRFWDVFSPDGALLKTVGLPGRAAIKLIHSGYAYGFESLESGEIVVVRVRVDL